MQGLQIDHKYLPSHHTPFEGIDSLEKKDAEILLKEFAFAISHDLNTPVRHMSSYLRVLKAELAEKKGEENLWLVERLEENLEIMQEQIRGMMDYHLALTRPFSLKELRLDAEIYQIFEYLDRLHIFNFTALLEKVEVRLEPTFLRFIIEELFTNAIRFSKEGEVASLMVELSQEGDRVLLDVKDEGIGFDLEFQDKLFQLFQHLHGSVDVPQVGAGAGLAIAQQMSKRMGGEIIPQSRPGQGSTFRLQLPLWLP